MGTFYWSTFQSLFTFTWVKKFSQYFYFHQSIFKHEYLYFYLSKGCVYFWHLCRAHIFCCCMDTNTANMLALGGTQEPLGIVGRVSEAHMF